MSPHPSDFLCPSLVEISTFNVSVNSSFLCNSYVSPPPVFFTPVQRLLGSGRVTRKTYVDAVVKHLPGAIVETPVSGAQMGVAIAHIFHVDPDNFVHPKDNLQYSLTGGRHNGTKDVTCFLLRNKDTGMPVKCEKTHYTCK